MIKFCDSHTDFLTYFNNEKQIKKYASKLKKFGGEKIICAVFTTEKKLKINDIIYYDNLINKINNDLKMNLILSIEDISFLNSFSDLEKLILLKPFSVTLSWNYDNKFCGGSYGKNNLTKEGVFLIKKLEKNDILIDTAHLNKKSFYSFSKITSKNIFNSHSNIYALFRHKRNLTNEQISLIKKSNGFLGLTFYQKFISNQNITLKNIFNQFDFLIENFGENNFGFGSDYLGFDKNFLPTNFENFGDLIYLKNEFKNKYSNEFYNNIFSTNLTKFIEKNSK